MTLRSAGEAVERLIDAFETELGAGSHQQALRLRVLGHTLHYFESVVHKHEGESDEDGPSLIELAKAHKRVADLAGKLGSIRREDVIKNYEAAIKILENARQGAGHGGGDHRGPRRAGQHLHEFGHHPLGSRPIGPRAGVLSQGARHPREGLSRVPHA